MSSYNYASFSPDNYDLQSADGPAVGQKAPDFELETPDGQTRRILDFPGDCLVLEIGSITCPLFMSRRDNMEKTARDYPGASSAVLYVREAHPGSAIPAHKTLDDKKACASLLKSDLHDPRTVLVDDVDGHAHQAYGSMPNAVYIIDKQGIVQFKAPWNSPAATRKALAAVLAGHAAPFKSYFKPANPRTVFETMHRAGSGSGRDFFRGLPRLIWNVLIKNNLRTFFTSP